MRVDESEQAKAPRLFSHLRKRGWDDLVLGGLSSIGLDSEKYLDHPQDYESHLTLLNLPPVHQSRLKRDLHELSSRKQQQQQQQTPIGTTTTSACEMCGDPVLTPGKQKLCNHCTFYSKA